MKYFLFSFLIWLLPFNAYSFEFTSCPDITKDIILKAENVMAGKVLSINEYENDNRFQEVVFQNEHLWKGVSSYGKKQNGIIHFLVLKYGEKPKNETPIGSFPYGSPVYNFEVGKRYIILAQYGRKYKVSFPVIEDRCNNVFQLDPAYENGTLEMIYSHLSRSVMSFKKGDLGCDVGKTETSYQQADFVFSGKVMTNKFLNHQIETNFLVEKVWKVPDIANVRVFQNVYTTLKDPLFCGLLSGDSGCGVEFEEDAYYIIYGKREGNAKYFKHPVGYEKMDESMPTIITSYCNGTRKLNKLKETKIPSIPIFEFRSNISY